MECRDGSYGEAQFSSGDFVNHASFSVRVSKNGYREAVEAARDIPIGVLCSGELIESENGIDPFVIKCSYQSVTFTGKTVLGHNQSTSASLGLTLSAAVEVKNISQDVRRFTAWIVTDP